MRNRYAVFFERDNVKILVHADNSCASDQLTVFLAIQIPENITVAFEEERISAASGQSLNYREGKLRPKDNQFDLRSMIGATKKHNHLFGGDDSYKVYYASAQIPLPNSDTYKVILPKIIINEGITSFPEINLDKTFSTYSHYHSQCWW
ncbi:MAG TPA: hypothetical protein VIO87_03375 [Methylotenera sp.]